MLYNNIMKHKLNPLKVNLLFSSVILFYLIVLNPIKCINFKLFFLCKTK